MKRPSLRKARAKPAPTDQPDTPETGIAGLPLPSTDPATNFLIADIVLRAASDLAREAIEKKTLAQTYDRAKAEELVTSQSIVKTIALYGISRIATRSPAGLALVAGGLVVKALYDRGKSIEARGGKAFPRLKLPGLPKKS
ncbi:MAG: hypothetical protein ACK4IS_10370 [Erythrobacter sp.]